MRVLIVDDSPADAELLVRELERCVDQFTWQRVDSLAALNLAMAVKPDVALVDLVMPALDGREALTLLHDRWPDLPVIVVTGALDDRDAAAVMEAGASDYLLKDRLGRLGGAIERTLLSQRQRERNARLIDGQNEVLTGIATGAPLATTLERIVRLVEAQAPDMFCTILRLDGGVVRHGAAPSLPDWWNKAIDGEPIGPHAGSCGTAMFIGAEVIVGDIATDPLWDKYRDGALKAGLRACWSRPVFSPDRKVLGAFAMYYTEPRQPSADEHQLLDVGMGLAAVALQKARTEASQRLAEHVLAGLSEAVLMFDDAFRVVDGNPAVERVTGYGVDELKGGDIQLLDTSKYEPEFRARIRRTIVADGAWHGELTCRRKNGESFAALVNVSTVAEGIPGVRYCAVVTDVSEVRDYENRLAFLAQHDPLTQLANREQFSQRLSAAIANARRGKFSLGVMVIDLDNFKTVNESLGHAAGDRLLNTVAARLRDLVRDSDLVARLGGDEFALLLADIDTPQDCAVLAERLLETLAQPLSVEGHELYATCSVGITVYPQDGEQGAVLMSNADSAMYGAKAQGRNGYQFFARDMQDQALDNLLLASALRNALANGEFVLHYQPRYSIKHRRLTGMEALIRWRHPTQGMIPPVRFIPVAEETGLIGAIGSWVLREACMQSGRWRAAGMPPFAMAVNLSARQLQAPDFADEVKRVLEETGMPARSLELEITESMLMRDPKGAAAALSKLAAIGVRIALDDFGTGYSSLSYLKQFVIHELKIDRSFVTGLPTDEDDRAIVRAILAVAKSLGMRTVAEGVETEPQLDCLNEMSCDEVQGYLMARPLPADEVKFP